MKKKVLKQEYLQNEKCTFTIYNDDRFLMKMINV